MAIRVPAQRISVAQAYASAAPNSALFTADPGATGTATTEVTATGSPAYARKAITGNWAVPTATDNGTVATVTGAATHDVPSGTTVTYAGVASSITQGAATVRDSNTVPSQAFASQGTYTVTYTFTEA